MCARASVICACTRVARVAQRTHLVCVPQMEAHVVPQIVEAKEIEKQGGLVLDLLMSVAPWFYVHHTADAPATWRNGQKEGAKGKLHVRPLDTEPGTEANKNCGHRRAHLVRAHLRPDTPADRGPRATGLSRAVGRSARAVRDDCRRGGNRRAARAALAPPRQRLRVPGL